MDKYVISTGTVTYALRGRDLLRNNGFKAYIERSTANDRIGCGYSITVAGNINKIIECLNRQDIRIAEIKKIN